MPFVGCHMCGRLMEPDRRSPGWYICPRCGNRATPSRPQISNVFIIAVWIIALVSGIFLWWRWALGQP
jgi:RNA polymerase subunit RPABC4/transcription elongation factor Spt4